MLWIVLRLAAVVAVILVGALVGLYVLGAQQPSRAITGHDRVVLAAVKHADPDHVSSTGFGAGEALWRARVVLPLIGANTVYWTDYLILPADSPLLDDLQNRAVFEDAYAAELTLTKIPALFLGVLRARHLLGLTRRPDGPLPEAVDEIGGRKDILPSNEAIEALVAAPEETSLTMVNYLAYKAKAPDAAEDGRTAYQRYGLQAIQTVHSVGGQFLFAGRIERVLVDSENSPVAGRWDDLAAMIYPNPTAILSMEQDADYRASLKHREDGLERTAVIATEAY